MEGLIKGLLNTALDAASSMLHQPESSSSHDSPSRSDDVESIDRSTWAEVVGGQGEDPRKGTHNEHQQRPHKESSWQNQHQQQSYSSASQYKHQVPDNHNKNGEGWQSGGGGHQHDENHYQPRPPPKQYHKVPDEQWQEFKKHSSKQEYAKPVSSAVDTEPTQEELRDLSAACGRLWELDLNRLTPGQDYEINCGEGKKIYEKEDMADNSLFRYVSRDVFQRSTFARFYALLDNYTASEGVQEHVTDEERQEEVAFIEEISRTAPVQYLFKYLEAKGVVSRSFQEFKQHLLSLWFESYGRGGSHRSSSAFEHVFVGEVKNGSEKQVSGFHNWIKFYVEEANGRVDYQGYILPRRRSQSQPDAHTQLLSIQFSWNGILKPVSSTFVGVSPEFELALYTLCFYGGQEDNYVSLGPYSLNIKCYHLGRDKIGSSFPIAED